MRKFLMIRHKVNNYENWKPTFDKDITTRQRHGIHDLFVLRDKEDPNEISTFYEVDDFAQASEIFNDEDLMAAMKAAGVSTVPTFSFYAEGD